MFIDSNIWCYYFTQDAKQHAQATQFLEQALEQEVYVSTVVLMEVSHYLYKALGAITGKECMQALLQLPINVIDFDYATLQEALTQLARYTHAGIGGRDASILAAMKQHNIQTLATHDKAFKSISTIQVTDPVK